jgi:hypothetical protein
MPGSACLRAAWLRRPWVARRADERQRAEQPAGRRGVAPLAIAHWPGKGGVARTPRSGEPAPRRGERAPRWARGGLRRTRCASISGALQRPSGAGPMACRALPSAAIGALPHGRQPGHRPVGALDIAPVQPGTGQSDPSVGQPAAAVESAQGDARCTTTGRLAPTSTVHVCTRRQSTWRPTRARLGAADVFGRWASGARHRLAPAWPAARSRDDRRRCARRDAFARSRSRWPVAHATGRTPCWRTSRARPRTCQRSPRHPAGALARPLSRAFRRATLERRRGASGASPGTLAHHGAHIQAPQASSQRAVLVSPQGSVGRVRRPAARGHRGSHRRRTVHDKPAVLPVTSTLCTHPPAAHRTAGMRSLRPPPTSSAGCTHTLDTGRSGPFSVRSRGDWRRRVWRDPPAGRVRGGRSRVLPAARRAGARHAPVRGLVSGRHGAWPALARRPATRRPEAALGALATRLRRATRRPRTHPRRAHHGHSTGHRRAQEGVTAKAHHTPNDSHRGAHRERQ